MCDKIFIVFSKCTNSVIEILSYKLYLLQIFCKITLNGKIVFFRFSETIDLGKKITIGLLNIFWKWQTDNFLINYILFVTISDKQTITKQLFFFKDSFNFHFYKNKMSTNYVKYYYVFICFWFVNW